MERLYISCEETTGDWFLEHFNDLESANKCAEDVWAHLTADERKNRHVYVGWIERSRDYVNDPEEDDWFDCFHSIDSNDECFDSAKLVEE